MLDDYTPIKPLLDFLNQEIPVISQVANLVGLGPVRFIDAIGALGSGARRPAARRRAHRHHRPLADIQAIADAGSVVIPLGDIKFGKGDRNRPQEEHLPAANIGDRWEKFADAYENIDQAGQAAKDFIDGLTGNNQGAALAHLAAAAFGSVETALGTFSIPLFQSPIKIVDLLFGKDVDLVTWDIPRLEAKFEFSQLFGPIIPRSPCSRRSAAGSGSSATCTWAWTPGHPHRRLLQGRLLRRHPQGPGRRPGSPGWASPWSSRPAAKLSIPFAKAGIEGGIQAQTADWNDPDDNGKVHFDELAENFSHGLQCVVRPGRQTRRLHRRTLYRDPLGITSITIIDVSFDIFHAYLRLQLHLPAAPGTGARDE